MNRSEVITGINALRNELEKGIDSNGKKQYAGVKRPLTFTFGFKELEYFEEVLCEARLAVLKNEQDDPYSK